MQHSSKTNFTTETRSTRRKADAKSALRATVNCTFVVELRCGTVQMLSFHYSLSSLGAQQGCRHFIVLACAAKLSMGTSYRFARRREE